MGTDIERMGRYHPCQRGTVFARLSLSHAPRGNFTMDTLSSRLCFLALTPAEVDALCWAITAKGAGWRSIQHDAPRGLSYPAVGSLACRLPASHWSGLFEALGDISSDRACRVIRTTEII